MGTWVTPAWRLTLVFVVAGMATARADDEPLHSVIDQGLKPIAGAEAPRASDAEFLRRVSLDLAGMPPKADEARAFLADPAPDERERLVDRLFASPHYARNLASALDLMLMERRPNTNVSADDWQAWLLKSVRENKPWNVLAREILQADGDDPAQRPAARFVLDRASDPNVLTRDIGRIFFGRDMQCAQCHDHPLVGEYLQTDYHGLLAFVSPSYPLVKTEGGKQTTIQSEKAGTDEAFQSVFVKKPRRTGARVPDGVVIEEPYFLPGDEYQVAPADNVKSVPKFSRRAKLAELATNGTNQAFNTNIANRLWGHMFGRGLVHPLDLHHPDNPAIDPALLKTLGERFAAMNFDIRGFLREVALSNVYQRSFDPPSQVLSLSVRANEDIAALEQERDKLKHSSGESSTSYAKASSAWEDSETAMLPAAGELDTARTQYAEAKKNLDDAVKAKTDASSQLTVKQKVAPPVQQAATAAQEAAKALPEDKELADAAQKFVAKSQLLVTEITALTKTVDEKTAAMPKLNDAFGVAKPKIEGALTKATPLEAAWKQNEKAMLAARLQADADAESLGAINRRIATARLIAKLPELKQKIAAAVQLVPVRDKELAAAKKQLDDFAAVIVAKETAMKAPTDAVAAATAKLEASRAAHAKVVEAAEAVVLAAAAAHTALEKAPTDAALADAAKKLQESADARRAETIESQKRVDGDAAARQAAADALVAAEKARADALAERTRLASVVDAATKSLAAAQADVPAKQAAFSTAETELTERWGKDFTIASLKALTPEQLCWTVFRVTGVYDRYWQAETAELDKTAPLTEPQKADAAQVAAHTGQLEQRTFDKLKGNIGTFVAYYGAASGQPQGDFFATADQALFAANGGAINSWVVPASDNVTDRMIKQADAHAAAEELYLTVLTRPPTDEEAADVATYLAKRAADKNVAAQELVWALLNSAEFRFNH